MPCFEAHHEIVTGYLVLCDGSRFGVILNDYLPKKPKPKPENCGDCRQFDKFQKTCKIDLHTTTADTQSCKQAINKDETGRAY